MKNTQADLKKLQETLQEKIDDTSLTRGINKTFNRDTPMSKFLGGKSYVERSIIPENFNIEGGKVFFPIEKTYLMIANIAPSLQNSDDYYCRIDLTGIKQSAVTSDMAITQFIMDESGQNEPYIMALFNSPECVDFSIIEQSSILLHGCNSVVQKDIVRSGAELKSSLLEDPRMKETHAELLRVKMIKIKEEEEKEKTILLDKQKNWFHQWKWLEKKRLDGEFKEVEKIENENHFLESES